MNQVVAQQSPDGGKSEFWYDRLGRLAISRNARQRNGTDVSLATETGRMYSYTRYDSLGRITEVGQVSNIQSNGLMTDAVSRNPVQLEQWLNALNNRRGQITSTIYDLPYSGFEGVGDARLVIKQRNLRNRVSYTTYADTGTSNLYNQGTFYTYDIVGNVDTLLQDYGKNDAVTANLMNKNGNRWKKIAYKYDLISGKVNMVMYQRGWQDGFYHRYSYDAENRLTLVETSTDSLVWEKDARYQYYHHGPLARVTLGDQQVQGTDYAYTLQGWLKGINATSPNATYTNNGQLTDMGGDADAANLNRYTAKDAYGLTLNYYTGDYSAINGSSPFPGYSGRLSDIGAYRPLYNGNISSSSVYQKKFDYDDAPGGPLIFYNYKYDQLNRLKAQDAYKGFNTTDNSWAGMTPMGEYLKERIAYDGNGNILKYLRNSISGSTAAMDSLTYWYNANTNQLNHVADQVVAGTYHSDGDKIRDINTQSADNYTYDAIGNLVADNAENISSIKWNVYGKITEINKAATADLPATKVQYTYDAAGNRISQVVTKDGTKYYTWYVRDAQGNMLTTYSAEGAESDLASLELKQTEQYLYGSSRLGLLRVDEDVDNSNAGPSGLQYYDGNEFDRGSKEYELTNHLGNVLATISDRKLAVSSAGSSLIDHYEPDIVTAQDYYPFGMLSRVALPNNDRPYRFGFNGQEMNNDVKGLGNIYTAQYWEYDSRIGRRWNIDPIPKVYESPYSVFGNNPIWNIDADGADTSKYLSNRQLLDAIKVAYNVVDKHVKDNTFYIGKDYTKEVNEAVSTYWEKNQNSWSFGANAEFQQQALDYYKGFKEVAGSINGNVTLEEYGEKILFNKSVKTAPTIIATQKLINSKNGEFGTVAQKAAQVFPIIMTEGIQPVGVGPKGPQFKAPVRDVDMAKFVTAEVNLPARMAKSGMSNAQAGRFFGWGKGIPSKTVNDFTRPMLEQNGWTKEVLQNVAEGYRRIGKADIGNPSALPRARQLESLLKLFD